MRNRVHRQPFLGHSPRYHAEDWARLNAKRNPTIQAMYRTQQWRDLRLTVLRAANYQCVSPGCPRRATIADHKTPHRGDNAVFFDADNLQAMCKPCHDYKTGAIDSGFGRAARERGRGVKGGG